MQVFKGVWENENLFVFGFKNRIIRKFDIHSDSFPTEAACNPQCKLEVTKITLLRSSIQCVE